MKPDEDTLLRLARAVSDEEAVEWDREASTSPDLRPTLNELRNLARVRQAYRDVAPRPDLATVPMRLPPETTPDDREPLLARWGELRIESRLGRGTCAEVFLARDSTEQHVALKLLRDKPDRPASATASFLKEAQRLTQVRHHNLLNVHGVAEHEGRTGMWYDLIRGDTLEEHLTKHGRLSDREAASIGREVCEALAAVHTAGLIHRDVKTSNVMREKDTGRIVLMDFSSALERGHAFQLGRTTTAGTPVYMAPELFEGHGSTVASDVYALGVVLYRLVTGTYPVPGDSYEEIRRKHRCGEQRPLQDLRPDLSAAFVHVVHRALAPDPEDRFRSAGAMNQALADSIGAPGEKPLPPPRPGWLERIARAAIPTLPLLLVLLAVYVATRPSFEVDASLYRRVRSTDERLSPGAEIRPGDTLFLEISGSHGFYAYIANEDAHGRAHRLFPLEAVDTQNPLDADAKHRLPGPAAGRPQYWSVDTVGGTERLLVIASRKQLAEVEALLDELPSAGSSGSVQLTNRGWLGRLRGMGGLTQDDWTEDSGGPSPISGLQGKVAFRWASSSDIRMWEIVLVNPGG